jgi:hypothetical protein
MGVKELTLGGIAISQYPAYKDNPVYQKAIEVEAQMADEQSAAAAAAAEEAAAAATAIADNSESVLAEYLATVASMRSQMGLSSGAVNNITINTPVGSEEALTEAVQKAVQQLNRYGYSQTFAGAIPTP